MKTGIGVFCKCGYPYLKKVDGGFLCGYCKRLNSIDDLRFESENMFDYDIYDLQIL